MDDMNPSSLPPAPPLDDERRLVELARAGDADAFAELVRRSSTSANRLALSRGPSSEVGAGSADAMPAAATFTSMGV